MRPSWDSAISSRVPGVNRCFSRSARGITTCPFEETVVVAMPHLTIHRKTSNAFDTALGVTDRTNVGRLRPCGGEGFGYDVLACPKCGGRLRLLALIGPSAVIARIRAHLGLPTEVAAARPSRAPPLPLESPSPWADDDLPAA